MSTWPKSCAKCGRDIYPRTWDVPNPSRHYGRGLCSADHQAARKSGELSDFVRGIRPSAETVEEVEFLCSAGLTRAQAAARLGVTEGAVCRARARAGVAA